MATSHSDRRAKADSTGISFLVVALFWTVVIGSLAGWHYYQAGEAALENARTAARHGFGKDQTFRRWATRHGGVYVPVSEDTPPNPYLAHVFERDITSPSGRPLTLVNPAYMLRQMHAMADELFGTRGHITSLKPLRPENAPDEWQIVALQAFDRGLDEYSSKTDMDGETYLRLMRPMIAELGCLKCHGHQGYQVGDILGGLSVAIPWAPYRQALLAALPGYGLGYGVLWLVGLGFIAISRRRLHEHLEKRRESEERLRLMEDNLPDSYVYQYRHDQNGTPEFLYLSQGIERLHGLRREAVLDDAGALHRQIDPEQFPVLVESETLSLKNLTDFQIELRMRRADDAWRWLQVRSRPRCWPDGSVVWDGVATDITEHKLSLESLRESEERYRELFLSNPQPMWVYDLDSLKFLAVNDAAVQHYGYSREEFLGMTIKDIRPSEDITRLLENVARVGAGYDEAGVWRHLKKDGSLIDVEIHSHTLVFDQRSAEMVLINDITERRRAEMAMRESKARLRHWHDLMRYIIEHDPNSIAVFDRNLRYLFVSDRFLRDYQVGKENIIGKSHYEVFPEIPEKWREVHRRALGGEVLGAEDEAFDREDGRIDYVRWQCRPWHERDGSIGGIVLYSEVVTERIEARQALQQRTLELEERSAELERFNYTVSHDLKSPLVTVKSFLGFLEQDLAAQNAERIQTDIGYIRAATMKMGQLLDELLEMSRIGRLVNPPVRVGFSDLVQEVLALVAGPIADSGVQVRVDDLDLTLWGDRPRFVEIWQNLVENAVKYAGGQPAPMIHIGMEQQEGERVFYVRDNGMGIDPRYSEKIFGLFEKLDKHSEGSGLGLALVKRIVGLYGGRIWVESAGEGQGSCFRFTLPGAFHAEGAQ